MSNTNVFFNGNFNGKEQPNFDGKNLKKNLGNVGIFTLVLFLVLTAFSAAYTVETGEVAIISTFGKVEGISGPGLNFRVPFIQSIEIMETREKNYTFVKTHYNGNFDYVGVDDTSMTVSTKDLQSVNIEFSVQASIVDPELLYTSFRNRHEASFIRPRVREIVQSTIAKYTIEEFISKRSEISKLILKSLEEDFKTYGIIVSNISIINHDFSNEYEAAIERKKVAEQAVETAKSEQEKLAVEASNRVKIAEYELQEKELKAKANQVEAASLSPELLEKMKIEKWNGVMPYVTGNSDTLISFDNLKGNQP